MSSTVFVIGADNSLTALKRSPYDSEDLFQRLLADHPAILAEACGGGDRLLLIKREAPVPEELAGSGRWSLDHLFIDGSGVPVLVEVKRATDTRLRREVVAQMLDYAANGVAYWPIDHIISAHAETCLERGEDAEASLSEFVGPSGDTDDFWRQVEANLRSGRIRMVIVADVIPKELRRIVEFLNEQMRPAEILAVAVEQHTTESGLRLLTPSVIGNTERAVTQKAVQPGGITFSTVQDWLAHVDATEPSYSAKVRMTFDWFVANGFSASMKKAGVSFGVHTKAGAEAFPFFLSSKAVWADLYHLGVHAPYESETARRSLLELFRALPGTPIKSDNPQGYPTLTWRHIDRKDVWSGFTNIALKLRQALKDG